MELQFGAMCPSLSSQIGPLIPQSVGDSIDRSAQAIDRLRIHQILSEREVRKARIRLIRIIERECKMAAKTAKKKK